MEAGIFPPSSLSRPQSTQKCADGGLCCFSGIKKVNWKFGSSQRKPNLLFATVPASEALNSANLIIRVDRSLLTGVIYPPPQVLLSAGLFTAPWRTNAPLLLLCPSLSLSFFGGHAGKILVLSFPQSGIQSESLAVKGRNPNHWTSREVLLLSLHSCDWLYI